jgi:hypothetical protein
MIRPDSNPVEWALLVQELADAYEHLGELIERMTQKNHCDENVFRVDMGHVMAHLNRAWARRNIGRELTNSEWEALREYPEDLKPIA